MLIIALHTGVLAARDGDIARLWLEALWRSVVDPQPAKAGEPRVPPPDSVLTGLRGALVDAFERGPTQRQYVQSLQGFSIADRGGYVPSAAISAAAVSSGSLQAGVLQVGAHSSAGIIAKMIVPSNRVQNFSKWSPHAHPV